MGYTIMPNPVKHTCWDEPMWDGTMQDDCKGCDQAEANKCDYCGYGWFFTTHNDLAHFDNGDTQVPDNPTDSWHDSPHVKEN